MKTLITGTSSGLGKFLSESMQCNKFDRNHPENIFNQNFNQKDIFYDCIIHCAFNQKNTISQSEIIPYLNDNIEFTKNLITKIKSNKFIFISSVDVYPPNSDTDENISINIDKVKNIYGKCKLICEEFVKTHNNYLILRCGGIIGNNKLPRSINDIFTKKSTTLTESSTVNYISQQFILDIINKQNDIKNEIINVSSDKSFMIKELTEFVFPITFGTYQYNVENIKTNKLKKLFPHITSLSSKDTLLNIINNKV